MPSLGLGSKRNKMIRKPLLAAVFGGGRAFGTPFPDGWEGTSRLGSEDLENESLEITIRGISDHLASEGASRVCWAQLVYVSSNEYELRYHAGTPADVARKSESLLNDSVWLRERELDELLTSIAIRIGKAAGDRKSGQRNQYVVVAHPEAERVVGAGGYYIHFVPPFGVVPVSTMQHELTVDEMIKLNQFFGK